MRFLRPANPRKLVLRRKNRRIMYLCVCSSVCCCLTIFIYLMFERFISSSFERKVYGYLREERGVLGVNGEVDLWTNRNGGMLALFSGDLLLFEKVMKDNPELCGFVELGTASGFTTLYLALTMKIRGCEVHTFDINDKRHDQVKKIWPDNAFFHKEDVLGHPNRKQPNKIVIQEVKKAQFIFLDNGRKHDEFKFYIDHVTAGSIVFIHDWEQQIIGKWKLRLIDDAVDEGKIEYIYKDYAETFVSRSRAFRKLK